MESQENKSKWDELARELGATPPAEREAPPVRAAESAIEESVSQVRPRGKPAATRAPSRPKANPQDWDTLAVDLGIQPSPVPAEPKQPESKREESQLKAVEEGPSEPTQPAPVSDREDVADETAAEESPAPPSERPEPVREESRGSVSLWHKIFGSPDEQAERIAEASTSSERSRLHEAGRAGADDRERAGRTREARDRDKPADTQLEHEDTSEQPTSAEPEIKKRRSRRRRGGRGRRQDAESGDEVRRATRQPATDVEMPSPKRSDRRATESRPQPRGDDFDNVDELDLGPDGDSDLDQDELDELGPRGQNVPAGHRNIPSWDEAIGLIVDANMQSRSERRRSSQKQSRGPNSGRGGARGRRKKKS